MNNPFSREQVLSVAQDILSRVLGMPASDIAEHHSIVEDLGAESLDFVELNTLVEKAFGLALPTRSVLDHAGRATGSPERFYDPRQGLTEEGAALLAASPYRYAGLRAGTTTYDIFNASTVGNLVNICHSILDHLPASCADCGCGRATVNAAARPACAACDAPLKPARGDEVLSLWVNDHLATSRATGS